MEAREILEHARDAMSARRVFGEPYEKDGTTVIPVANVMGGTGAGGGPVPEAGAGSAAGSGEGAPATPPSGYGWGYGVRATPVGVYVIRDGQVEWKPAVDVNRLALQRALVAIVGLLVLRTFVKAVFRR